MRKKVEQREEKLTTKRFPKATVSSHPDMTMLFMLLGA